MNFPFFLARRFFRGGAGRRGASAPAVRIATLGVALGLAVMIVSLSVVRGFKREISAKIIGFGSHVEVLDVRSQGQPEAYPVGAPQGFLRRLAALPGVAHVQRASVKMGVLKTAADFRGIQLKGIGPEYDCSFLRGCIVEGALPDFSRPGSEDKIVVSRQQAEALGLKVGQRVYAYFFEQTVKTRRFEVAAVYNTNMKQLDRMTVIGALSTVNRLNGWTDGQCARIEVRLDDFSELDEGTARVAALVKASPGECGAGSAAYSIRALYPQVFSWLDLLDFNVVIILILMVCVAGFTMVSGLFILILERVSAIGILKAMGMSNTRLRGLFLWLSAFVVGRGLLLGNAIGLLLVGLQARFGLVGLDAEAYYVDTVPVSLEVWPLVVLNVGTLFVTLLALVVPSYMVSLVQPAKSIRFD